MALSARRPRRRLVQRLALALMGVIATIVLSACGIVLGTGTYTKTYHSGGFTYTCVYRTQWVFPDPNTNSLWNYFGRKVTTVVGGDRRFC